MRWTQTLPPATEPIEIGQALEHLNLGGVESCAPNEANYVQGLIAKARNFVEQKESRQLILATWLAARDTFPPRNDILEVRGKLPLRSVKSIKYYDENGAVVEMAPEDYQVDALDFDRPGRIKPSVGKLWPATQLERLGAVELELECGFGNWALDIPETVQTALLYMVAQMYAIREPITTMRIEKVPGDAMQFALDLLAWGDYR